MATKFHIKKDGNPGECTAQPGNCPFGADEPHYDSKDAARQSYADRVDAWIEYDDKRMELESQVEMYRDGVAEGKFQIQKMEAEIDSMGMEHESYGDAIRALDGLYDSLWDDEDKMKRYQEELDDLEEVENPFDSSK